MANLDELKNDIRERIKTNNVIPTIVGDISILESIGQGGNSIVFDADWQKKQFAVKILALNYQKEKKSKKYFRFIDEIHGLITLSNSNVTTPIYHFDLFENTYPFFVMPKYDYTLDKWIEENPITDFERLKKIISNLIASLQVIHRANIVHRDLKPQNIFIDENENIILGDFGIAWFDPKHYDKSLQTGKKDRLANFEFLAPEQRHNSTGPTPTMDVYALGQIIQWMVTGETHHGESRIQLSTVDQSFSVLDPFIFHLLQTKPQNRLQDADSAAEFFYDVIKKKSFPDITQKYDEIEKFYEINNEQKRQTSEFNFRIKKAIPGSIGYKQVNEIHDVERLLHSVGKNCREYNLWYTMGSQYDQITRFEKWIGNIWLINAFECKFKDVWIYRNKTFLRNYILLHLKRMDSFGFPGQQGEKFENAGYFRDQYIPSSEFEDGYAIINGEPIQLQNYDSRTRFLTDTFLILAPEKSVFLSEHKNDAAITNVISKLSSYGRITRELLEPLEHLERELWMKVFE